MIIALAGRRIDSPDMSPSRFPTSQASNVRACLKDFFEKKKVTALVCSAACGADLLALDVAGELNLQRKMILPFEREKFRSLSVVDRPGNWGFLFDKIYDALAVSDDIVILHSSHNDDTAFLEANIEILNQAILLNEQSAITEENLLALLVWDGKPKSANDATQSFKEEAQNRGIAVAEILTIPKAI